MDAKKTDMIHLFSGFETRFLIPVFQRSYNWGHSQCIQLFNDVCNLIHNKSREHFFGSVVLNREKMDIYTVIDGQQRMTTVSLMWIALYQIYKEKKKTSNDHMANAIWELFNFNSLSDGTLMTRIENVEIDRAAYLAIIEGNKEHFIEDSNITSNYLLLYNMIEKSEYSIDDFFHAINRLMVVRIELEDGDNAQEIFESLNSTGMALTDGDKIRNFILMDLKSDIQSQYYKDYWKEIEKYSNFTRSNKNRQMAVSNFVRDFMTAKTGHIPVISKVYVEFKQYKEEKEPNTLSLLRSMKEYSCYLYQIENARTNSAKLNRILRRLTLLAMTVLHPFELRLVAAFYSGNISENETCNILELIENYIFRRTLCEVPTNTLNKTFATLFDISDKLSKEKGITLYDAIVYLLTSKTGTGRFPSDAEFKEAWSTRDIYKMKGSRIYVFLCLNGGKSPEGDTSVIEKMQAGKNGKPELSVEHIMPQQLTKEWINELGGPENAQRIQEQWGNTIANLTLTAYNSDFSNSSFEKKLKLKNSKGEVIGFSNSPLPINNYVKTQITWGEKQLTERLAIVQKRSVNEFWKYPTVKYKPDGDKTEDLTLENANSDFTDKGFLYGTINGETIPVKAKESWKHVFIAIMETLDAEYHSTLKHIAADESITALQDESTKTRTSRALFGGFYVRLNVSAATLIGYLQDILPALDISLDSVTFHVYSKKRPVDIQSEDINTLSSE